MRRPRLAIAALALLLPLAACGTSGGEDGASAPEGDGSSGAPTVAELESILPTAEEVGEGYTVVEDDEEDSADDPGTDDATDDATDGAADDATDDAFAEACPGADILEGLDDADDDADQVTREFENEQQATIEVSLESTPDDITEEKVAELIDVLNECGTIEMEEDGTSMELTFEAEPYDEHGDYGAQISMEATATVMGIPLEIGFSGVLFSQDGTTVSVTASSGLDEDTFEQVPADDELIAPLAELMSQRLADL